MEQPTEAATRTKPVTSMVAALDKCAKNGHKLVSVFDVRPVLGGHTVSDDILDTFKAQCSECKALLRFYYGRFMGEAYTTTCRQVRVLGTGPVFEHRSASELRALEGFEDYTLNNWRDAIHEYAIDKGWWDVSYAASRNFGDLIALVHTELSEAYEEWRNGHKPDEAYYREDGKPEGIPSELMDVLIRVLDMCGFFGIDVDKFIEEKHRFNLTREYRHGGKQS